MTKVSKYGQWQYPGEDTIIPNVNGSITMQGVSYPVLGIDDLGNQQMMLPGANYQFPGNSVYEIPFPHKNWTDSGFDRGIGKGTGVNWPIALTREQKALDDWQRLTSNGNPTFLKRYPVPGDKTYEQLLSRQNGGDISVPSLKRVKIHALPKAQQGSQVSNTDTWHEFLNSVGVTEPSFHNISQQQIDNLFEYDKRNSKAYPTNYEELKKLKKDISAKGEESIKNSAYNDSLTALIDAYNDFYPMSELGSRSQFTNAASMFGSAEMDKKGNVVFSPVNSDINTPKIKIPENDWYDYNAGRKQLPAEINNQLAQIRKEQIKKDASVWSSDSGNKYRVSPIEWVDASPKYLLKGDNVDKGPNDWYTSKIMFRHPIDYYDKTLNKTHRLLSRLDDDKSYRENRNDVYRDTLTPAIYPKPEYSVKSVKPTMQEFEYTDKNGNLVKGIIPAVSRQDSETLRNNLYYDVPGGDWLTNYKNKVELYNLTQKNLGKLKQYDPNFQFLPITDNSETQKKASRYEKMYLTDPSVGFYQNTANEEVEKPCEHCESLYGSTESSNAQNTYRTYGVQYPSLGIYEDPNKISSGTRRLDSKNVPQTLKRIRQRYVDYDYMDQRGDTNVSPNEIPVQNLSPGLRNPDVKTNVPVQVIEDPKLRSRRINEEIQNRQASFAQGGPLPKAQNMGQFNPSFNTGKSLAENIELNRRAHAMGWNSVEEYRNSGWGQNKLALQQQALLSNPQVQQAAKISAEMNPELANAQVKQDWLNTDNRSKAEKAIAQTYYTLSNPVEAAGHAMKYGYVPQGNVGNYEHKEDSNAMSATVNMINPMMWLNGAYRFTGDLSKKESWTTTHGAVNMVMDVADALPLVEAAGPVTKGVQQAGKYFTRTALKPAIANYKALGEELRGTLTTPKAERMAAIQEGNDFSTMWAQHPGTYAKIDKIIKGKSQDVINQIMKDHPDMPHDIAIEIARQRLTPLARDLHTATKYTGNSAEIPLPIQVLETLAFEAPPHKGNWGFTYRHGIPTIEKAAMGEGKSMSYSPYTKNWVSRTPRMDKLQRASTAVHENTHDWINYQTLEESGQQDFIKTLRDPKDNETFETWNKLRDEGKSNEEIAEIMGKQKAYEGYLLDPTEVHARIMQLRHQIGWEPTRVLSSDEAVMLHNAITNKGTVLEPQFSITYKNDPENLKKMFNKLLTPAAVVGGAEYLKSASNKKKLGGAIFDKGGFTDTSSYDPSKAYKENIELSRRAKEMGWDSVEDYKNSGWGQNKLALQQKELLADPKIQEAVKLSKDLNPNLYTVEREDNLYANKTTPGQKVINQTYYALSNPMDAYGHYSKYGYVPQGNIGNYGHREDGDAFATVINDFANPFSWGNAAYRLSKDVKNKDSWTTKEGAKTMGTDALEALPFYATAAKAAPTVGKALGVVEDVTTAAGRAIKNSYNVSKELSKIKSAGIKAGKNEFEIAKEQLEKVGITSNQRKGYMPGVSEVLNKYVVPFGYGDLGADGSKLAETFESIRHGGWKNYSAMGEDVNQMRGDAWSMYLGIPQKYNTFRMANTAPVMHPAYKPGSLKGMDIYSIPEEKVFTRASKFKESFPYGDDFMMPLENPIILDRDANIMGGYNKVLSKDGLQYNDIWDLDPTLRYERFVPKQVREVLPDKFFNRQIPVSIDPSNPMVDFAHTTISSPRKIKIPVSKFIGKPFMSHGNLNYTSADYVLDAQNHLADKLNIVAPEGSSSEILNGLQTPATTVRYNKALKIEEQLKKLKSGEYPKYKKGGVAQQDEFQDGGMPLGLPLKEQNIYLLPEYYQPKNPKTGEILPDPQRPGLGMDTGATEYKYTYGTNAGNIDIPSIVAGQYIGDQALDRYNLTGERFKTMNDPSSYSKFYDTVSQLGIMQEKKKGGELKRVRVSSLPKNWKSQ